MRNKLDSWISVLRKCKLSLWNRFYPTVHNREKLPVCAVPNTLWEICWCTRTCVYNMTNKNTKPIICYSWFIVSLQKSGRIFKKLNNFTRSIIPLLLQKIRQIWKPRYGWAETNSQNPLQLLIRYGVTLLDGHLSMTASFHNQFSKCCPITCLFHLLLQPIFQLTFGGLKWQVFTVHRQRDWIEGYLIPIRFDNMTA